MTFSFLITYNYDGMDSGCETVSIVTGDGGYGHLVGQYYILQSGSPTV